jgi:DMSO/TMAO reductase YedYZ molybdopterin-dependent catalytic subunit
VNPLFTQIMTGIKLDGAPLRVYSAVKLGYKMVKYLTEVRFLPIQTGGHWENQGYDWFAGA